MHFIIDILYGVGGYKNDTIITSLGKSGITIAEKVTTLCLASLQEAISEYEKIQINLLKTTEQRGLILNQPLSDQFFNLAFHATINERQCPLHIAIPDALFEDITFQEGTQPIENTNTSIVNDSLKKDIIESTITLIASLQDIKLKITDIMNLKTGDLIPIQDPTIVFMAHNQKKIFKGTVGQSNSLRVVKIIDNL
jgi:flagellar motor switch protein FliM